MFPIVALMVLTTAADPYDPYSSYAGARTRSASLRSADSEVVQEAPSEEDAPWKDRARFFSGVRMGVGIPAGGDGLATNLGGEVGVSVPYGVGFGLHLITTLNPPDAPVFGIRKTDYALGAAFDMRFYIQTVEPLTLYPTMSIGFLAGPDSGTGRNVVLPLINPGFGGRVKFGDVYAAFEFGLASFSIPFVNLSFGYEGPTRKETALARARHTAPAASYEAPMPAASAPVPQPAPASAPPLPVPAPEPLPVPIQ